LEEFGWFGGIGERKILFRIKKEADQAGFKGTRTGPLSGSHNDGTQAIFPPKSNDVFDTPCQFGNSAVYVLR